MTFTVADQGENHRGWLEHLFEVGVTHCQPRTVLPSRLPTGAPQGRNIVLGAGKAAAEMAAVAFAQLDGQTEGLVVTRYGHGARSSTGDIEVIEAGHPVPDKQSVDAATKMLAIAETATAEDRVLFVFSGGGSALLCAPIDGIRVQQKQDITRFLLHSGASIDEINRVRKHLSRIKGGGLASAASRAELLTYVISDVVGNDPSDVASGPSVGIKWDVDAAIRVLEKYRYTDTAAVAAAMRQAEKPEAPSHPIDVVATASTAVDAIAKEVSAKGWTPVIIGDDVEGDATAVGRAHAELAKRKQKGGQRIALISGGELTVKVHNELGRGGPNQEYLASLMLYLDGAQGIEAIACDSDGIDGSEDNAGAYISWWSLDRAADKLIDPAALLATNNTYECFSALGDLIITGPTLTNVNDIRVILVNL